MIFPEKTHNTALVEASLRLDSHYRPQNLFLDLSSISVPSVLTRFVFFFVTQGWISERWSTVCNQLHSFLKCAQYFWRWVAIVGRIWVQYEWDRGSWWLLSKEAKCTQVVSNCIYYYLLFIIIINITFIHIITCLFHHFTWYFIWCNKHNSTFQNKGQNPFIAIYSPEEIAAAFYPASAPTSHFLPSKRLFLWPGHLKDMMEENLALWCPAAVMLQIRSEGTPEDWALEMSRGTAGAPDSPYVGDITCSSEALSSLGNTLHYPFDECELEVYFKTKIT